MLIGYAIGISMTKYVTHTWQSDPTFGQFRQACPVSVPPTAMRLMGVWYIEAVAVVHWVGLGVALPSHPPKWIGVPAGTDGVGAGGPGVGGGGGARLLR